MPFCAVLGMLLIKLQLFIQVTEMLSVWPLARDVLLLHFGCVNVNPKGIQMLLMSWRLGCCLLFHLLREGQ